MTSALYNPSVSLPWSDTAGRHSKDMLHIHLQPIYFVQDQSYASCEHWTDWVRTNYLCSTTHCTSTTLHMTAELCLGSSTQKYGSCHLTGWRIIALATKHSQSTTAHCKHPHPLHCRLHNKLWKKSTLSLHLGHFLEYFLEKIMLFTEPSPDTSTSIWLLPFLSLNNSSVFLSRSG